MCVRESDSVCVKRNVYVCWGERESVCEREIDESDYYESDIF